MLIHDKIQSVTSKGQITLPVALRRLYGAKNISLRANGAVLQIVPVRMRSHGDEVIFDSVRDNGGKGVPIEEFIRTLKKIRKEESRAKIA